MTMRRLRQRFTAAVSQKPSGHPGGRLPERFPYNRPWFLALDAEHAAVSGDHGTRVIISARDSDNLPGRAGYAEVINAGKSTLNEDQAHACDLFVGRRESCRYSTSLRLKHHLSDTNATDNDKGIGTEHSQIHYLPGSRDENLNTDKADLHPACQCEVDTEHCSVEFKPIIQQKQSDSLQTSDTGLDIDHSDHEEQHDRLDRGILQDVPRGLEMGTDLSVQEDERWMMRYFAVFDGHAGAGAALMAVNLLHHIIRKNLCDVREELMRRQTVADNSPQEHGVLRKGSVDLPSPYRDRSASIGADSLVIGALETAFKEMDAVIGRQRTEYEIRGGCTALVAVVFIGKLYVANAGDSRAVMSHKGEVIPMSVDFTPLRERGRLQTLAHLKPELLHNEFCRLEFPKRVTQTDVGRRMLYRDAPMTGWSMKIITEDDTKFPLIYGEGKRARLMATIGVTRGFGDHGLSVYDTDIRIKPFLTPLPEVKVYDLGAESHGPDDVLIMGTDGLWDVVTNDEAQDIVLDSLAHLDDSDKLRYTSAAFELVLAARGLQEDGTWQLKDGRQASNDDITALVIPLLGCAQLLSPSPRNDDS